MFSKLIVDSWKLIVEGTVADRVSTRRHSLSTHNYPLSTRPAFTLIEILVVLGIITLIAALGVPVYNALTGARSVEAAQNQVAAYLGQARTIAINEGKSAGVLFYVDPATERTAMALILVGDTTLEDPDPYDKYKGWISTEQYKTGNLDPDNNGDTSDRTRADRVIGMVSDGDSAYDASSYPAAPAANYVDPRRYMGNLRPSVKIWRAEQNNNNAPVRIGTRNAGNWVTTIGDPQTPGTNSYSRTGSAIPKNNYANANWDLSTDKVISQYAQSEQQLLPKGIGVQVIIQPTKRSDDSLASTNLDRYVRTGIILFDPQGRLVLRDMMLPKSTTLGEYLDLTTDAQGLLTGIGIALYNDTQFRAYTTNNRQTSQADWVYGGANTNTYKINSSATPFSDYPTASFADEQAEEDWLANNTVPVLINRFSGSLTGTE